MGLVQDGIAAILLERSLPADSFVLNKSPAVKLGAFVSR